jgi:hypothetical protein
MDNERGGERERERNRGIEGSHHIWRGAAIHTYPSRAHFDGDVGDGDVWGEDAADGNGKDACIWLDLTASTL